MKTLLVLMAITSNGVETSRVNLFPTPETCNAWLAEGVIEHDGVLNITDRGYTAAVIKLEDNTQYAVCHPIEAVTE